jgi:hypothetical protein
MAVTEWADQANAAAGNCCARWLQAVTAADEAHQASKPWPSVTVCQFNMATLPESSIPPPPPHTHLLSVLARQQPAILHVHACQCADSKGLSRKGGGVV